MKNLRFALIGLLLIGASACTEEKTTEKTSETRVIEREAEPATKTTEVKVEEKDEPNVKVKIGKDGTNVGVKNDDVDIEVDR